MDKDKMIKINNTYQKYVVPIACIMILVGGIWACIDLQSSPYPWAGYILVILAIFLAYSGGKESWKEQWRKEKK